MARPKQSNRRSQGTADLTGRVFELYGAGLLRYLLRCRGCTQDADDLAQEVYLQLLRVDEADAVRQPQAYVYRIASHVVYRFKQRKQREGEFVTFDSEALEQLSDHTGADPGAHETGDQLDVERELERLLAKLPPLYRAIIVLQKRDGLSYAQVAERLGISVHTVKKYLHRALVQLRNSGPAD